MTSKEESFHLVNSQLLKFVVELTFAVSLNQVLVNREVDYSPFL
jgi:hypothetical protein